MIPKCFLVSCFCLLSLLSTLENSTIFQLLKVVELFTIKKLLANCLQVSAWHQSEEEKVNERLIFTTCVFKIF